MSDDNEPTAKVVVVPLTGKDRGKWGWMLRTSDFAIQCLRKFPSADAALQDASAFAEAPVQALH